MGFLASRMANRDEATAKELSGPERATEALRIAGFERRAQRRV